MSRRTLAALATLAAIFLAAPAAHAESGRYNLRVSVGPGGPPFGFVGEAAFDLQLAPPFALEFTAGGGYVTDGNTEGGVLTIGAGARFRFAEDYSGYLDEGGSGAGNFWFAPHAGFAFAIDGAAFMADISVGYDFSIAAPFSIGPFARGILVVADFVGGIVTGGVSMTFEFEPIRPPVEPDVDLDRDGVFDRSDACPGTLFGATVDGRGCVPMVRVLVLDGIVFAYDSAQIDPSSENTLNQAASMLIDNPDVSVEIGGHTDDIGSADYNERLSLDRATAVRDWLVGHGVGAARLSVRGYGSSQPLAPNTDEASRSRNRRIEFRQLDR
jgi:outer membrane protein OmpA-like peptidoglycan-associated protein